MVLTSKDGSLCVMFKLKILLSYKNKSVSSITEKRGKVKLESRKNREDSVKIL